MTRDPGARVAAILSLLRPVVDEIVVAADVAAPEADVAAYVAVADRVHRFPHDGGERHLGWAHRLCSADTILRLDGDEVPSAALLRALPELAADADAAQTFLPRRWLFGSAATWLEEHPWWPDFQGRLVRNDRRLWFRGELHWGAEPAGPVRFAPPGFYHLDLLLHSFQERLEKARRYEERQPARTIAARGELNHAYYLPERRPRLALADVPAEDARLIEAVLGARDVESRGDPAAVPIADREEVDRHWSGRALPDSAYRARLRCFAPPPPIAVGEDAAVALEVTNPGTEPWPGGWEHRPLIRLAYRWWDPAGSRVLAEGARTPLPQPLGPGESAIVPVGVTGPESPGPHTLEIDLVHEEVRWFGCALRLEVDVLRGERGWGFATAGLAPPKAGWRRVRRRRRRGAPAYLGWLGYGNLGDEAMFEAARTVLPQVVGVPHRDLGDDGWLAEAGAVVLGGGTLIGHAEFRTALERAVAASVPVHVLPAGVEDRAYRREDGEALGAELRRWEPMLRRLEPVPVRGPRSRELLAALGVEAAVVGDPALLLGDGEPARADPPRVLGLNAGVAWRMWGRDPDGLVDQLATVAAEMREGGWRTRLVSIWGRDEPFVDAVARRSGDVEVVHASSVREALAAIAGCRLFAGMKLHSVVLASAAGVPALSLAYQPKCVDFMASLGREQWALRTDELTPAGVVEALERLEGERDRHVAELVAAVRAQRERLRTELERIAAATS